MPRHPPPPGYTIHVEFKSLGRAFETDCRNSGFSGKDAKDFIYALLDIIATELAAGRPVAVPYLGQFNRVARTRLTYQNPHTRINVPRAHNYGITFTPVKQLRDYIR